MIQLGAYDGWNVQTTLPSLSLTFLSPSVAVTSMFPALLYRNQHLNQVWSTGSCFVWVIKLSQRFTWEAELKIWRCNNVDILSWATPNFVIVLLVFTIAWKPHPCFVCVCMHNIQPITGLHRVTPINRLLLQQECKPCSMLASHGITTMVLLKHNVALTCK